MQATVTGKNFLEEGFAGSIRAYIREARVTEALVKSLNVKMAVAVHYAYQSSRLIYFQPHAASQVYIERLFSVCRDVVAGKHSRMTSSRERRASLSES